MMKRTIVILAAALICLAAGAQNQIDTTKCQTSHCQHLECPAHSLKTVCDSTVECDQACPFQCPEEIPDLKWYIGPSGGLQAFAGTDYQQYTVCELMVPVEGIVFGRKVNKWLRIDGDVTIAEFKGLVRRHDLPSQRFATEEIYDLNAHLNKQSGHYLQIYSRAGFDIRYILFGENPDRKGTLLPYIGLGVISGLGTNYAGMSNVDFTHSFDYGLEYQYRFNRHFAGLIDLHGNGLGLQMESEGCQIHCLHASYGGKLGLLYYFNFSK